MMSSRIRRLSQLRKLWIITLALLIIGGGWVWHQNTKPYHFLAVEEGVFYRSGTLPREDLKKVIATYKIRTVINLRSPKENMESWYEEQKRILREHKVEMLDIPMLYDTPAYQRTDRNTTETVGRPHSAAGANSLPARGGPNRNDGRCLSSGVSKAEQ